MSLSKIAKNCDECGTSYFPRASATSVNKHFFCSRSCWKNHQTRVAQETRETRFWSKVDKTDGCWLWTAQVKLGKWDYGFIHWNGKPASAHRISWELAYGAIPDGLFVCHKCDTPRCARPDHLFLGTQSDNLLDMGRKGRHFSVTSPERIPRGDRHPLRLRPELAARGEKNGSAKLTSEQVECARRAYASGSANMTEIASWYGVHKTTIQRVVRKINWRS